MPKSSTATVGQDAHDLVSVETTDIDVACGRIGRDPFGPELRHLRNLTTSSAGSCGAAILSQALTDRSKVVTLPQTVEEDILGQVGRGTEFGRHR